MIHQPMIAPPMAWLSSAASGTPERVESCSIQLGPPVQRPPAKGGLGG
ncbi:MAG: hypothetical protein ACK40I_01155 [Tabrizicola sp.]